MAQSIASTLWSILSTIKKGTDIFVEGISLPSWMYEPLSILQRQAEMIEYGNVLTAASLCNDSIDILAHVAAFTVSSYSATQRYKPSFNPLLGETFGFIDQRTSTKFIAEQVSHHPPVSALHAENENWLFWQNTGPTTKLFGNSIDIVTNGQSFCSFPKTNDKFHYTNTSTRVHNILFGTMWLEHYGQVSIKNTRNGQTCVINFKKSGVFQGPQYKVDGFVCDANGNQCVKIEGRWDEYVDGTWLVDTGGFKKGETKRLWQITPDNFIGEQFNLSYFAASLNEFDDMEELVPPTDSRRRLDRFFVDRGDITAATHWKRVMEDKQREERKKRGNNKWVPNWFKPEKSDDKSLDKMIWVYKGDYWEQREKKEELYREGRDPGDLLIPSSIKGLACDFSSYGVDINIQDSNTTTTDADRSDDSDSPNMIDDEEGNKESHNNEESDTQESIEESDNQKEIQQ